MAGTKMDDAHTHHWQEQLRPGGHINQQLPDTARDEPASHSPSSAYTGAVRTHLLHTT